MAVGRTFDRFFLIRLGLLYNEAIGLRQFRSECLVGVRGRRRFGLLRRQFQGRWSFLLFWFGRVWSGDGGPRDHDRIGHDWQCRLAQLICFWRRLEFDGRIRRGNCQIGLS